MCVGIFVALCKNKTTSGSPGEPPGEARPLSNDVQVSHPVFGWRFDICGSEPRVFTTLLSTRVGSEVIHDLPTRVFIGGAVSECFPAVFFVVLLESPRDIKMHSKFFGCV